MATQTKKSNTKTKSNTSATRRPHPVMFEPVAVFNENAAKRVRELSEQAVDSGKKAGRCLSQLVREGRPFGRGRLRAGRQQHEAGLGREHCQGSGRLHARDHQGLRPGRARARFVTVGRSDTVVRPVRADHPAGAHRGGNSRPFASRSNDLRLSGRRRKPSRPTLVRSMLIGAARQAAQSSPTPLVRCALFAPACSAI